VLSNIVKINKKRDENPNLLLVKNHDRKPNVVRLLSNVSDSQKEI
jgi:hypothetical protein